MSRIHSECFDPDPSGRWVGADVLVREEPDDEEEDEENDREEGDDENEEDDGYSE